MPKKLPPAKTKKINGKDIYVTQSPQILAWREYRKSRMEKVEKFKVKVNRLAKEAKANEPVKDEASHAELIKNPFLDEQPIDDLWKLVK